MIGLPGGEKSMTITDIFSHLDKSTNVTDRHWATAKTVFIVSCGKNDVLMQHI